MLKIGDKIRIIHLTDEPYNSNYVGKVGEITHINTDCYGVIRYGGTWGGIYIYPDEDKFEKVD